MQFQKLPAFNEGKPVGFVYQESKHRPSYQVHQKGNKGLVAQADTIEGLAEQIQVMSGTIVWLTRKQIAALTVHRGKEAMRPLTREEDLQLFCLAR
ncbi:hypothetical protein HZA43_00275 [Candidatus Peregrinibacteria bacterium]|nr:hypothetical protein [Candidatus Peregrinibacteria bacterium]